jgi:hypothetical protein
MADLDRIRVEWSGGPGGAGISTFYCDPSATSALADVRVFFDAVKAYFSDDLAWTFPNTGDTIDSTTGLLVGGWTRSAATTVVGGAASGWVAGVGVRAVWSTSVVLNGRRPKGSTFLTGLGIASFDSDGSIGTTPLATMRAAAVALVASSTDFYVWSRPNGLGQSGFSTITGSDIPDRVSWLRTRRL